MDGFDGRQIRMAVVTESRLTRDGRCPAHGCMVQIDSLCPECLIASAPDVGVDIAQLPSQASIIVIDDVSEAEVLSRAKQKLKP